MPRHSTLKRTRILIPHHIHVTCDMASKQASSTRTYRVPLAMSSRDARHAASISLKICSVPHKSNVRALISSRTLSIHERRAMHMFCSRPKFLKTFPKYHAHVWVKHDHRCYTPPTYDFNWTRLTFSYNFCLGSTAARLFNYLELNIALSLTSGSYSVFVRNRINA